MLLAPAQHLSPVTPITSLAVEATGIVKMLRHVNDDVSIINELPATLGIIQWPPKQYIRRNNKRMWTERSVFLWHSTSMQMSALLVVQFSDLHGDYRMRFAIKWVPNIPDASKPTYKR
uniref:Uncharacterized protein n=1 Tax=Romanomermis culicivorax TaxID=13658 RepID=A0A915J149_ROMCU